MHPLTDFSVDDLVDASTAVREMAAGASTMVEVAQRVTDHLYQLFLGDDGQPGCVSVRLYKMHRIDKLPEDLRATAAEAADGPIDRTTRALVLLSSTDETGVMPELQAADLVRPLTPDVLEDGGLLLKMIDAVGLDLGALINPEASVERQLHRQTYNAFLLADVPSSEWTTDEVRPVVEQIGLRSMVALGGVLVSGEVFFVVLFTRVTVPERTADLLRSLALAVQAALTPFAIYKVFTPNP